jgi:hypothetical protein
VLVNRPHNFGSSVRAHFGSRNPIQDKFHCGKFHAIGRLGLKPN